MSVLCTEIQQIRTNQTNIMKKYFPIRIFSIRFGYGWWWGTYFFFFGKHATAFAIMPMSAHHGSCTYENGKAIEDGTTHSWHPERQAEKKRMLNARITIERIDIFNKTRTPCS